ncbi:hypothetical protein [Streptomyces aurantiogriseus]|uniref:Uncharacterized protein n=1 Tax=Streptomyces aurantiogriseus TaxID=66870 RepID=A0A918BXM6_9ACTN|nr:hypothetical protein [Streptomyces aurantiogriseus]GGQ96008.1 hypothetical protein GCM10010251_08390 [Streptomyces aurantiogriseus]
MAAGLFVLLTTLEAIRRIGESRRRSAPRRRLLRLGALVLGGVALLAAVPASATTGRTENGSSSCRAGADPTVTTRATTPGAEVLHTYRMSFATEMANAIRVNKAKLLPLLPEGYEPVSASDVGVGGENDGVFVIVNVCNENFSIDGTVSQPTSLVNIPSILVREPADAAAAGLNIPGAFHIYPLDIYINDQAYVDSLRSADMPVQLIPDITHDRRIDDTGVGELTVRVPARKNPFASFNEGLGFSSTGRVDVVVWYEGDKGTAALTFQFDLAQEGPARSEVFTEPGTKLNHILTGGGLGPGPTDPDTGFESIRTPSLSFQYPQGGSGSLILIKKPCGYGSLCAER